MGAFWSAEIINWPRSQYICANTVVRPKKLCNDMIADGAPFSATVNIISGKQISKEQSNRLREEVFNTYKPFEIWADNNFFMIIWDPTVKYPSLVANIANYIIAQISSEVAVSLHNAGFHDFVVVEVDLFVGELYEHRAMLERYQIEQIHTL